MAAQWDEIRRDFPGLERQVYLNAAAASLVPRPVREAAQRYYGELEQGGDSHWDAWLARRDEARRRVARFLGASPDEIAFVPSTSAGINLIADLLQDDGAVLCGEDEFPALTLPWIHRGVGVHFMPTVEGVLRLESFAAAQAPKAATIAVSHVQFSNGCRQDLDAFGAQKAQRRLVVSASQSLGAFPVDVRRSRIDALACAGHKWLCAGYGAGLLYVSRELLSQRRPRAAGWMSVEDPFAFDNRRCSLRRDAARYELGCPAFAGVFTLGAAVEYIEDIGVDAIAERVLALNMYLTFRLGREGFEVLSPRGEHRSGQTLVRVDQPARAHAFLRERGIAVTLKPEGLRVSTHFYNNEADVDTGVSVLAEFRRTLSA